MSPSSSWIHAETDVLTEFGRSDSVFSRSGFIRPVPVALIPALKKYFRDVA